MQWVKDLAFSLQCRFDPRPRCSGLRILHCCSCGSDSIFDPWPENFHVLQVQAKKKKKRPRKAKRPPGWALLAEGTATPDREQRHRAAERYPETGQNLGVARGTAGKVRGPNGEEFCAQAW